MKRWIFPNKKSKRRPEFIGQKPKKEQSMKKMIAVMLAMGVLMLFGGSYAFAESVNAQMTIKGGQKYYVPIKDETLAFIAQKFQISVEEIMRENPQIKNKHLIYAGEEIKLPLYTAPQVGVINVPVPVNVSVTEKTITNTAPSTNMNFFWLMAGTIAILAIGMVIMALPRREKKEEKTIPNNIRPMLAPRLGEAIVEYESRCRMHPKGMPVECWFRCEASKKGLLTAGHIVRHHGRCENNPAKKSALPNAA